MCFDNAFTVFAGPNGGGKSSLVYSLWKDNPSAPYVCADSIAKEAPICGIQNSDQRNLAAMVKAQEIVNDRLLKRLSVAYETVLSSDYKRNAHLCILCYHMRPVNKRAPRQTPRP